MEQMQLLMALSLYLNSIKDKEVILVPATPEMLFGSEASDEEIDDEEYDYEYEEEEGELDQEDQLSLEASGSVSLDWQSESWVTELGDDGAEFAER